MGLVAMRLVEQAATAIHLYVLYLNLVRGLALDYELYAKGVNEWKYSSTMDKSKTHAESFCCWADRNRN